MNTTAGLKVVRAIIGGVLLCIREGSNVASFSLPPPLPRGGVVSGEIGIGRRKGEKSRTIRDFSLAGFQSCEMAEVGGVNWDDDWLNFRTTVAALLVQSCEQPANRQDKQHDIRELWQAATSNAKTSVTHEK